MADEKVFTMEEVQKHAKPGDAWLAIDGDVYDISKFMRMHPGGAALLAEYAGKECTEAFFDMHRSEILVKYARLRIGRLNTAAPDRVRAVDQHVPGTLSMVPYAEHMSLQGWNSPYRTDSHKQFRIAVRSWYDENIRPVAVQYAKANKTPPLKLFQAMGKAGLLAAALAPSKMLLKAVKELNIPCPSGTWEEFDLIKEGIVHEESILTGVPGFSDGLAGGYTIACPTVLNYGTPKMHKEVLPDLLRGNKRICLAISEPFAGSDVAGIKTTAVKSADGSHYVVNGVKKWITSGHDSDYFITAVNTGKPGVRGMSLLLIERGEGVSTKIIKTSYSASAGTAYITFENVKVPCENILGKENKGFRPILHNFNHERWMIIANTTAHCRLILKECILWANQRKVFGKPLISQPVIQSKLAEMAAQIEALSAWLDFVTHQMMTMDYAEQNKKLGGPIGLLKFHCTRVSLMVADHSSQIFGGRAITRTGMGQNVERFARAVKYAAIYGGSEEIMQSLAAKQMLKLMPINARL